jgi:hypothetical protein
MDAVTARNSDLITPRRARQILRSLPNTHPPSTAL